jgi:hypothetical protein
MQIGQKYRVVGNTCDHRFKKGKVLIFIGRIGGLSHFADEEDKGYEWLLNEDVEAIPTIDWEAIEKEWNRVKTTGILPRNIFNWFKEAIEKQLNAKT